MTVVAMSRRILGNGNIMRRRQSVQKQQKNKSYALQRRKNEEEMKSLMAQQQQQRQLRPRPPQGAPRQPQPPRSRNRQSFSEHVRPTRLLPAGRKRGANPGSCKVLPSLPPQETPNRQRRKRPLSSKQQWVAEAPLSLAPLSPVRKLPLSRSGASLRPGLASRPGHLSGRRRLLPEVPTGYLRPK